MEGAEAEVLRGATELLARCRPAVRFGFHPFAFTHPQYAQAEIVERLQAAGLRTETRADEPWGLREINCICQP